MREQPSRRPCSGDRQQADPAPAVEPVPGAPELPGPALGGPGHGVVQVNVEEDMRIGADSTPVNEAATDQYHLYLARTVAMIATALLVIALLGLPVAWAVIELLGLAGVLGLGIWAWVLSAIALSIAAALIGYWTARRAL